jgi:hypothetical protein
VGYDEEKIRRALTPQIDLNIVDAKYEQLSLFTSPQEGTSAKLLPFANRPIHKLQLLDDAPTALTGDL